LASDSLHSFGATSAFIVSVKDEEKQTEAISQQPIDHEGVKMASNAQGLRNW
jgi:hypothetical protein